MQVVEIPLTKLHPHPMNSNVMPPPLLKKLAAHIARTGIYPPVVVRPVEGAAHGENAAGWNAAGSDAGCCLGASPSPGSADLADLSLGGRGEAFQILDGHHRVLALRQIGAAAARCVVWDVDDAEALTLLATLNRLQGADDPKKRATLLAAVAAARGLELAALARLMPERHVQVQALMKLNEPPALRPPRPVDDLPVCVHFFLPREQRDALEARLHQIGGPREAALMKLVEQMSPLRGSKSHRPPHPGLRPGLTNASPSG